MSTWALIIWLIAAAISQVDASAASLVGEPRLEFTNRTQAVIRWTTDVSTGSRVFYGESSAQMTRRAEGPQGLEHAVVLPALSPGTKWFYTVGTARFALATNSFSVPGGSTLERAPPVAGVNSKAALAAAPPTRETWGYLPSLRDHFERHGADFRAANPDDYARMAWEFRQRAQAEGLPTKIDSEGVIRIFDRKSGVFGAYNRNGTTKTFFKPGSRDYFERQPGDLVNPKEKN